MPRLAPPRKKDKRPAGRPGARQQTRLPRALGREFEHMLVSSSVAFKSCDTSAEQIGTLLSGLEVRMPSNCGKCGCAIALIFSENNHSSLRCASCVAHLGWVSHATERFLHTLVECFGRPTKPIEIHRKRLAELSPPPSGVAADDNQNIIAPEKAKTQ